MADRSSETDRALTVVVAGHVGHGKSTLAGRLLHETGGTPAGTAEGDRGSSVDSTRFALRTKARRYVLVDAPGIEAYAKDAAAGAADADAALLVIDAEEGVSERTRRHAYLLHLLGVSQVAVAVDGMDRVGHARDRLDSVAEAIRHYLGSLGIVPSAIVPVSARDGSLVAAPDAGMPWYMGPGILEALDALEPRTPPADTPTSQANAVLVRVFWLDREPLAAGDRLNLRIGPADVPVTVESVRRVIDPQSLKDSESDRVAPDGFADVVLRSRSKIVFHPAAAGSVLGRGALVRDGRIVGGCLVRASADEVAENRNLTAVAHSVSRDERARALGHRGGVLWLTGLSGSGKSTLAMALQRQLFDRGCAVYVLDGDNVRSGLNGDLGFSAADRTENIRRVAEAANLFADAGFIVITAFISPYRDDRRRARKIIGENFLEVFVQADLETCERRDPKGLYKKARAGKIPSFTGISDPYEEPVEAALIVDTANNDVEACVAELVRFVEARTHLAAAGGATG